MKWKTLSSEYLFKDSWLKARKDTCERPDGKIVTPYYVMEYTPWVGGLGVTEDNKIVLIKQYRHALGEVCIELPGGCVDTADPDNEHAIRREMLEETGYTFNNATYLGRISANPSTNSNLFHMYLLEGGKLMQEQQLDANEDIEVFLVTFEELKEMLDRNEIVQSMHVSAIYYALKRLGKLKITL
ncbi:MAG: hydrolase [Segetibacter sp.]|nr:hydrolase [Segetibacter sp.]